MKFVRQSSKFTDAGTAAADSSRTSIQCRRVPFPRIRSGSRKHEPNYGIAVRVHLTIQASETNWCTVIAEYV
jgi:hypothetical protein